MKYHPGKVLQVYPPKHASVTAADESTQALVRMWDENVLTVGVEKKLVDHLRIEDTVLIDYNPISDKCTVPKMLITKILKGTLAEETWKVYDEYHKNKQEEKPDIVPLPKYSYG